MSLFVLDTSAVLALFWQEPGWERVSEVLEGNNHAIGAANFAELVSKFVDAGLPIGEIQNLLVSLQLNIHPIDDVLAMDTGKLRADTRHLGLSLGDRACLALARKINAVALTADRPWVKLDLGIAVECIR